MNKWFVVFLFLVGSELTSFNAQTIETQKLEFLIGHFHDGHQPQLRAAIREHGSTIKEKYHLTEDEISLVISFLQTLDDPTFVFNAEHQFPKTFFRH